MMPWDAVGKVTAREYQRKSRFFLEFAGMVDPKLTHHAKGINKMVVPKEKAEIDRGMKAFIQKSMRTRS